MKFRVFKHKDFWGDVLRVELGVNRGLMFSITLKGEEVSSKALLSRERCTPLGKRLLEWDFGKRIKSIEWE